MGTAGWAWYTHSIDVSSNLSGCEWGNKMQQGVYLIISGHVQGVGYRRWFEKEAKALGLKGYVKNLISGEVSAVIVGDERAVQSMLDQSMIGPKNAKVTALHQVTYADHQYNDFSIQY